jgi:hypothetical protein
MSDRTFRLILDGKKGGLVKGSTPSSAAKKAYKKLSGEQMKNSTVFHQLSLKDKVLKTETGKSSFKFELQETTKDSKKKVYGPYKGFLNNEKINVKLVGGMKSTENKKKFKNQYGGNRQLEIIEININDEEKNILNVQMFLKDDIIVPQGLPDVLKPYAESYPYKKLLDYLIWSVENLPRIRDRLFKLNLSSNDERIKGNELSSKIDALIASAKRDILYIKGIIESKNYNQEDIDKALMIHQEEFGPPPNWKEIIPLKNAYSNALFPRNKNGVVIQQNKPLNNSERNKLYKLTKSLKSQALNLCIDIEKKRAFYNAVGYFKRELENDALSQLNALF